MIWFTSAKIQNIPNYLIIRDIKKSKINLFVAQTDKEYFLFHGDKDIEKFSIKNLGLEKFFTLHSSLFT